MAKCKYCGEPAGLLTNQHEECEQKYLQGKYKFHKLLKSNVFKDVNWIDYKDELTNIANSSYFSQSDVKPLMIKAWNDAVEEKLIESETPLTDEQVKPAQKFQGAFELSPRELNERGLWSKLVESVVISELVEGVIPDRSGHTKDELPIMFTSNEKLVWIFANDTQYLKLQTKTKMVGRHAGYSGRLLKDLYYRWGRFESQSIKSLETEHIDTGHLAITNENIYFYGAREAFKLPYSRILAIEPLKEGVKIQKTQSNAYPITFVTGDGWFIHNLLINLHKLAME